jgi:hypothetical protein
MQLLLEQHIGLLIAWWLLQPRLLLLRLLVLLLLRTCLPYACTLDGFLQQVQHGMHTLSNKSHTGSGPDARC